MAWNAYAQRVLEGGCLTRDEALTMVSAPQEDLLDIVRAAYRLRVKFFGKTVKLNFLLNAKSGLCPEDCHYCSQSKLSTSPIDKYSWMPSEDVVDAASRAVSAKASRLCIVASGRGPADHEVDRVVDAVHAVRRAHPSLEICCCLGLMSVQQASRLKAAGVWAVNHNLNTSERFYPEICDTHTYQDRVQTIEAVKAAGLSSCSGALFGQGERDEDIVDVAFDLRDRRVESIPVNFLIPIDGTPLGRHHPDLTPSRCLNILAMFRMVNPSSELRIAGGRELHLRWLQPLGLYIANSIFIGDYVTTKGQPAAEDLNMIRDLGFHILGDAGLVETTSNEHAEGISRAWIVQLK